MIEHRQVEANGGRFHLAISGPEDGPAMLCLHGFPEGWMTWREIMGLLGGVRIYAPDLRGYPGSTSTGDRYDVFTLTDDVAALIEVLGLDRPLLVAHDWGGELAWIFAHRYSHLIRRLVVVNGTHPRTLVRAVLRNQAWQGFRLPWVPWFELPWMPEWVMTSRVGRRLLRWSIVVREGTKGAIDRELVDEMLARFQQPADLTGPIGYYRAIVATLLSGAGRRRLREVYTTPITVPVTVIWGVEDGGLPLTVALGSGDDGGCEVEWRRLEGVGHFVTLEAPERLARELSLLVPAGA